MATKKQMIFVLGMHRSGTSAVTRMLNLMGATLGDDLLPAQESVNARGFWEHRKLVAINERLMGKLGREWYDVRALPEDWLHNPEFASYRSNIRDFIEQNFAQKPLSALKDPRLCRVLTVWLDALRGADLQMSSVLVLRDPHEVVASIRKRDPLDEITGYLLWARYTREAEIQSRHLPRSIITYGALLNDWREAARKIADDLNIQWPEDMESSAGKIDKEIDPNLRHQQGSGTNTSSGIVNLCEHIYSTLSDPDAIQHETTLDLLWRELDQHLSVSNDIIEGLAKTNQQLIEMLQGQSKLGDEMDKLRQTLGARETTLTETQQELQSLGITHADALETLNTQAKQLEDIGEKHRHCLDVIQVRDQTLQEVNSQLESLGESHQHALEIINVRDGEVAMLNDRLELLKSTLPGKLAYLIKRNQLPK
ncbi:MAG: sulfotransferase [bacterium]